MTYLPKLDGQKHYLFVAIDRATRIMYHKIYTEKTAENAQLFFDRCLAFFPFGITHILTDNGLEFTNIMSIYKWLKRYKAGGIFGLNTKAGQGRPPILEAEHIAMVRAAVG